MCYHISQREKSPQVIESVFDRQISFIDELVPVYYHLNGFDHGNLMVITEDKPDIIQLATWGIVPPDYTGDFTEYWKKYSGGVLNTRDDKFFHNNSWKDDCILERKCLIIVDGIFEPHHPADKSNVVPYYFEKKDSSHFCLWGIYTQHGDLITCSILTTRANPVFTKIHNNAKRMPFCIDPVDVDYHLKLGREQDIINEFLDFKAIELEYRPVNRDVLNSKKESNRPDILDMVDDDNTNLTLF